MPLAAVWEPSSQLIAVERLESGRAVSLNHPAYPFVMHVGGTGYGVELLAVGAAYLRKAGALYDLPDLIQPAGHDFAPRPVGAHQSSGLQMTWLPVGSDPRESLVVKRNNFPNNQATILDRMVSLFAVQTLVANDADWAPRNRLGIRINAYIRPDNSGNWIIGVTGSMMSADLATSLTTHAPALEPLFNQFRVLGNFRVIFSQLRVLTAQGLGVYPADVTSDGYSLRLLGQPDALLESFVNVRRTAVAGERYSQSVTEEIRIRNWSSYEIVRRESHPLSANMADLFTHPQGSNYAVDRLVDPSSQGQAGNIEDARPNRSPDELDRFRHTIPMPPVPVGAPPIPLADPFGWFEVRQSRLVRDSANEDMPETFDPAGTPSARSNEFAALSAYRQTSDLFNVIDDCGLSRNEIFRFAAPPLIVRYRSTIRPGSGKDGKTVNAQVDFDPPENDYFDLWDPINRRQLQVRFALGDVKRSSSKREPLGLATDPRWSWHEFCHVMLAGSTGKLELPFAHSAGDALAAIACDPHSVLMEDSRKPGMRGATFPWTYIDRRHDREVREGWSWSGTYHRQDRLTLANFNCRHKGYDSEQILATSLFRVYLALGGETVKWDPILARTVPDVGARKAASDYTVYLILRTILALGAANAVPLETPEQFASLLANADATTERAAAGPLASRAGGCAFKVIRWAFEAQGMYAKVPSATIHNAPGSPPDVDLFIDNGRPASEGPKPRGGYVPVSLDWIAPRPAWHATGDDQSRTGAIVLADIQALVRVNNRGSMLASEVEVKISYIEWLQGDPVHPWNSGNWHTVVANGPQAIAAGAQGEFHAQLQFPRRGRYLILAETNCKEDLSISNPETGLPCSAGPIALEQLVAGDNNLGLRTYVY